jgi:hypothetical protein
MRVVNASVVSRLVSSVHLLWFVCRVFKGTYIKVVVHVLVPVLWVSMLILRVFNVWGVGFSLHHFVYNVIILVVHVVFLHICYIITHVSYHVLFSISNILNNVKNVFLHVYLVFLFISVFLVSLRIYLIMVHVSFNVLLAK